MYHSQMLKCGKCSESFFEKWGIQTWGHDRRRLLLFHDRLRVLSRNDVGVGDVLGAAHARAAALVQRVLQAHDLGSEIKNSILG